MKKQAVKKMYKNCVKKMSIFYHVEDGLMHNNI